MFSSDVFLASPHTPSMTSVAELLGAKAKEYWCKDAPYRSYTPYIALGSRRGISSVIRPFGGLVQRGALDYLPLTEEIPLLLPRAV